MIICIGGLPGSGKSTISKILAQRIDAEFIESDDLLPVNLKPKIAAGVKLEDAELDDWIYSVLRTSLELETEKPVVVAALLAKPAYLNFLIRNSEACIYINLVAKYDVLAKRVLQRDHFATTKTLDFCWEFADSILFADHKIDASQPIEQIVSECLVVIKTPPNT